MGDLGGCPRVRSAARGAHERSLWLGRRQRGLSVGGAAVISWARSGWQGVFGLLHQCWNWSSFGFRFVMLEHTVGKETPGCCLGNRWGGGVKEESASEFSYWPERTAP